MLEQDIKEIKESLKDIKESLNIVKDRKITKKEASDLIGCSYRTLIKRIENGDLNVYKDAGSEKLSYNEVVEYINR